MVRGCSRRSACLFSPEGADLKIRESRVRQCYWPFVARGGNGIRAKARAKSGGGGEQDRERSYSSSTGGQPRNERVTSFRQRERGSKTKRKKKRKERVVVSNVTGRRIARRWQRRRTRGGPSRFFIHFYAPFCNFAFIVPTASGAYACHMQPVHYIHILHPCAIFGRFWLKAKTFRYP